MHAAGAEHRLSMHAAGVSIQLQLCATEHPMFCSAPAPCHALQGIDQLCSCAAQMLHLALRHELVLQRVWLP